MVSTLAMSVYWVELTQTQISSDALGTGPSPKGFQCQWVVDVKKALNLPTNTNSLLNWSQGMLPSGHPSQTVHHCSELRYAHLVTLTAGASSTPVALRGRATGASCREGVELGST